MKDDVICRSPHVSKGLTFNVRVKPLLTRGLLQWLDDRRHDLSDASLELAVVGYGGADGDFGGGDGGDALGDHLGGVDEEAGRDAFFEAVAPEVADLLADLDQVGGGFNVDAAFFGDDLGLGFGVGVIELHRDEALARGLFEVLKDRLIARIVRNDEHEIVGSLDHGAAFFDRQTAAVVGERVDDDDRVFAGLDDLVEIADRTVANSGRQRAVVPDCFFALEQKAADEIGRGEVLVTGDGDERTIEAMRHVFDKARLAAPGRAFEHRRQLRRKRRFEKLDLLSDG